MTLSELVSGVRLALDYPLPGQLTDEKILDKLADASQLLLLQAQNTGLSWCVQSVDITVGAGQIDPGYLIPAANFAKDIVVRTIDPVDPFHVSREVRRVDIQDVDRYFQGPAVAPMGGPYHNAVCCTVTRVGGSTYIKFFPDPFKLATYRIWYEVGSFPVDLGSEPFLNPFHPYLKLRAAVSCLPYCEWLGLSDDANTAKQTELAAYFVNNIREHDHAFKVWITFDRIESVGRRPGFGYYFEPNEWRWDTVSGGGGGPDFPPEPSPPVDVGAYLTEEGGRILTEMGGFLLLEDGFMPPAYLAEDGGRLLTEDGGLLLLEG